MAKNVMSKDELKEVGLTIQRARKFKGISEAKFAEHFNISNNTLRSIEKGKGGRFDVVIDMLRYLDLMDILNKK